MHAPRSIVLATLLFALAACAAPPAPATPALWEVRDADTVITLLGSVHELPGDVDWLRGPVAAAADHADTLVLELAPDQLAAAPALVAALGGDETVPPLLERVTPIIADDVFLHGSRMGMNVAAVNRTESWVLALAVGVSRARDAGLGSGSGVETQLIDHFTARQRPIIGLETARGQLGLFDALPPATQDQLLVSMLDDDAVGDPQAVVRAWARGDIDGIAREADRQTRAVPGLAEPLVHRRNRAFAAWIAARLGRPGHVLVAVGAGHMVGPMGVPTLLSAQGLQARRVQ